MLKKEILTYLENQTAFIDIDQISDVFTAKKLAEYFNVKRNTISHYLNQLNEEELLVKVKFIIFIKVRLNINFFL